MGEKAVGAVGQALGDGAGQRRLGCRPAEGDGGDGGSAVESLGAWRRQASLSLVAGMRVGPRDGGIS